MALLVAWWWHMSIWSSCLLLNTSQLFPIALHDEVMSSMCTNDMHSKHIPINLWQFYIQTDIFFVDKSQEHSWDLHVCIREIFCFHISSIRVCEWLFLLANQEILMIHIFLSKIKQSRWGYSRCCYSIAHQSAFVLQLHTLLAWFLSRLITWGIPILSFWPPGKHTIWRIEWHVPEIWFL